MHQFLKIIFGIKLYMFRTVPLSIMRSFSLYTQQWYMSYRFADSLWAGSARNWNVSGCQLAIICVIPRNCFEENIYRKISFVVMEKEIQSRHFVITPRVCLYIKHCDSELRKSTSEESEYMFFFVDI